MAPKSVRERNRQLARDIVPDAAERLLQKSETADFTMRALAAEAGVGFATPFNHFGSKNAIMQALSSRLIERMARRFRHEAPGGDAIDRVLAMGRVSVALLLEKPDVHKAVVGSLGVATPDLARSDRTHGIYGRWRWGICKRFGGATLRRVISL
jgi:AcrR family transcriptional regulator